MEALCTCCTQSTRSYVWPLRSPSCSCHITTRSSKAACTSTTPARARSHCVSTRPAPAHWHWAYALSVSRGASAPLVGRLLHDVGSYNRHLVVVAKNATPKKKNIALCACSVCLRRAHRQRTVCHGEKHWNEEYRDQTGECFLAFSLALKCVIYIHLKGGSGN